MLVYFNILQSEMTKFTRASISSSTDEAVFPNPGEYIKVTSQHMNLRLPCYLESDMSDRPNVKRRQGMFQVKFG